MPRARPGPERWWGMPEKKKSCFVIAPIGEEDSEIRRRSDQVLEYVITPAVTQQGYEKPVRADKISEAGVITSQIIEKIVEADLVVADLTGQNANVFYELAIRHTFKKPVILLIELGDDIPFDVFQNRAIRFNHRDLGSVEACKKEIERQIKNFQDNSQQVDSPISMTLDLRDLRKSDNPRDQKIADLFSAIEAMRGDIRHLWIDKFIGQVGGVRSEKPVFQMKGPDGSISVFADGETDSMKVLRKLRQHLQMMETSEGVELKLCNLWEDD